MKSSFCQSSVLLCTARRFILTPHLWLLDIEPRRSWFFSCCFQNRWVSNHAREKWPHRMLRIDCQDTVEERKPAGWSECLRSTENTLLTSSKGMSLYWGNPFSLRKVFLTYFCGNIWYRFASVNHCCIVDHVVLNSGHSCSGTVAMFYWTDSGKRSVWFPHVKRTDSVDRHFTVCSVIHICTLWIHPAELWYRMILLG